jgi:hypothetical protein
MVLIISVTTLEIEEWTVNIFRENVTIKYFLLDADGRIWIRDEAIFWRTLPSPTDDEGNPISIPDNWYQLPIEYAIHLNDITTHAEGILQNKFLN